MTAIVVSIQPHGFSEYTNKEPEEDDVEDRPISTNDCLNGLPRSQYSQEDVMHENDNDSVASSSASSAIPSLNNTSMDASTMDATMEEEELQHGGLNNLGNTCYLNSALQMVASLDEFGQQVKQLAPPQEQESKLREALIDVIERLKKGETIRPDDFKSQVDERSPLFVGYRQQDSHEFLTTLFDLLDEDYKKKEEEEAAAADQEMEDAGEATSIQQDAEEEHVEPQHDEVESSPVKKQRLEEDTTEDTNDEIKSIPPRTHSFKNLLFADIENLLHGDSSKTKQAKDKVQQQQEPKCKLVGGRMNPAGVSLTNSFEGTCVAGEEGEESSTALKRAEQDQDDADSAHTKTNSPVDSYFTTEVRVCLTCDSCKYRRSHTETYLHLSLEIGQNCSSLEDGLRKFFAPEKREIKCEKCFCETAMQATEITKLPRALLFHLKRFIVDISPDYTSISYRKDQSPVSYEEDLFFVENGVLNDFLASDVSLPQGGNSYGIRSVVNHIGSSASCGHYTADAKRQYKGQREWSRFNDSIVSKISSTDAVENASRTAYMIMYEIEP